MAKWRQDSDKLTLECFEYDWSYCNIPKIVKAEDDLAKIKDFWKSKY